MCGVCDYLLSWIILCPREPSDVPAVPFRWSVVLSAALPITSPPCIPCMSASFKSLHLWCCSNAAFSILKTSVASHGLHPTTFLRANGTRLAASVQCLSGRYFHEMYAKCSLYESYRFCLIRCWCCIHLHSNEEKLIFVRLPLSLNTFPETDMWREIQSVCGNVCCLVP